MNKEGYQKPHRRKSHLWVWFVVTPIVLLFSLLMVVGTLEGVGFVPSIEVQQGDEVPKQQVDKLIEEGVLFKDEKIEYFYSEGFLSVMGGGNILTEDKVISYSKDEDGKLAIYETNITDITKIELIEEGNFLNDAIYRIYDGPDSWLEIWLSVENDGHLKFINALEAKVPENTP